MALINLRRILTTDSIAQQVDKTNYNFEQIALAGGGPVGPAGIGIAGIPGGPGRQGIQGVPGAPGELWYLATTNPPSLNQQAPATGAQTIWLNVMTGTFFQFNGTTWVNKGAFTVSNFWSKLNSMIYNTEYTDQLVLSDEESGISSAPVVSNDDAFLLKINSTGGAHIILTNGTGNDAEGVTFRLTATDFFLDSVSALINLNITSQKGINLNSVTDTSLSSNANINLTSVGNVNVTSSNGNVVVTASKQLNIYSQIFQTYIQSKVGISLGALFNPQEILQVGNTDAPGNLLIVRGNGLNDGNLKFQRNGFQTTIDTDILTQNQLIHIPNLSGEFAVMRDFNDASQFDGNWVKNENQYSFGYTQDGGGGYSYKTKMTRGTGFYQVGDGAILEQNSGVNSYGATFFVTTYYKIVGDIVLFRWNMLVKTFSSDVSIGSENILGLSFPLPFDSSYTSKNHIQAASPIETTTGDNFSVNNTRATHTGNLIQGTANFANKDFVFQVTPTRNSGSTFTGSRLIILLSNVHFEYNTGDYYNLSGEGTLNMVDLVNTTDSVNVLSDLSNYLTGTPVVTPYSTSIPYRGCIVYSSITGLTKFDSEGKGISGDVIGFQLCNGNNGTRDYRGRTPYHYDSTNPLFNSLGTPGGSSQTILIEANLPSFTVKTPINAEHYTTSPGGSDHPYGAATPSVRTDILTSEVVGSSTPFNTISPYITELWVMNIINPNFGSIITTTTLPAGIYAELSVVNQVNNPGTGATYANTTGDIIVSFYSDPSGTIPYSVSGITFNYQEKTIYSNTASPSLNYTNYVNMSKVCSGSIVTLIAGQTLSETYYTDSTHAAVSESTVNSFTGQTGTGYSVI